MLLVGLALALTEDVTQKSNFALLLEKQVKKDCNQQIFTKPHICSPSKFRNPDGICNNAQNPYWGSNGDAFLRIIPSEYADGKTIPKNSLDPVVPLPFPNILVDLIEKMDVPLKQNRDLTLLFALWGQLITDDIAKIYVLDDKKDCCGKDINDKTYCYADQGETCKDYKRTASSRLNFTCTFGMSIVYYKN